MARSKVWLTAIALVVCVIGQTVASHSSQLHQCEPIRKKNTNKVIIETLQAKDKRVDSETYMLLKSSSDTDAKLTELEVDATVGQLLEFNTWNERDCLKDKFSDRKQFADLFDTRRARYRTPFDHAKSYHLYEYCKGINAAVLDWCHTELAKSIEVRLANHKEAIGKFDQDVKNHLGMRYVFNQVDIASVLDNELNGGHDFRELQEVCLILDRELGLVVGELPFWSTYYDYCKHIIWIGQTKGYIGHQVFRYESSISEPLKRKELSAKLRASYYYSDLVEVKAYNAYKILVRLLGKNEKDYDLGHYSVNKLISLNTWTINDCRDRQRYDEFEQMCKNYESANDGVKDYICHIKEVFFKRCRSQLYYFMEKQLADREETIIKFSSDVKKLLTNREKNSYKSIAKAVGKVLAKKKSEEVTELEKICKILRCEENHLAFYTNSAIDYTPRILDKMSDCYEFCEHVFGYEPTDYMKKASTCIRKLLPSS